MATPPEKKPAGPHLSYSQMSRLGKAKGNEFSIRSLFKYGYRNKEDISNLPPETLVIGSQNVLTNAAEIVGIRQGYVLDGAAGYQNDYGVDSAYDFETRLGPRENLRKWGANLEVRYMNPVTSVVSWINIMSTLIATNVVNFTSFYDQNTEAKTFCLFGNGDPNVYEWSGGMASFASSSNSAGQIGIFNSIPASAGQNGSGGTGYTLGDVLTISGGNGDAKLTVTSIIQGAIGSSTVVNVGGTGYSGGDIITITGGSYAAYLRVLTVDGSGAILTFSIINNGSGYPLATAASTAVTGGGTGATFNVIPVATIGYWQLTHGTGYSPGNNIATTGGTGTGATVSITSVASNSITISGTDTLAQLGFYDQPVNAGKFKLLINGATYTYIASQASGFTFVGITPDPTLAGIQVGDAIIQLPVGTTNSNGNTTPFLGNGFNIDLIATLENQVWYGDKTKNTVFVSKTNNYMNVSYSTPARLPAEGALIVLDSPPVGFSPQSGQMYITAGKDQWWLSQKNQQTVTVAGIATPTETLYASRLKTALNQASQGQGLIGRYKNSLVYVSNEQIVNALGLVKDVFSDPQVTNMSDPIKFDVDAYDFTNGEVLYDNYYIYVAIPVNGVVRMYNVQKQYWEAPQIIPVSRFYHTNVTTGNVIYGHSSLTNESYQLFTGYNDNGNPINAVIAFPYVSSVGGAPFEKKSFNKVYTEGYIASNSTIMETINYDFGGFSGSYTTIISGTDANIIFNKITDGSLGRNSLGTEPIGSILNLPYPTAIPKFRIINTMPRVDVFEYQIVYSSDDVDFNWSILRFGPAISPSSNLPTNITE